jgi:hypothetical protein
VTDPRHVDVPWSAPAWPASPLRARFWTPAARSRCTRPGTVGGRLRSVGAEESAVDLGASWFWPEEPQVQALAEQLGVGTFEQWLGGDALFDDAGARGPQRLDGNPIDVRVVRTLPRSRRCLCATVTRDAD